jgi:S-adenosylmethionine:tRNA ribosyltransferase-isomerase
MRTDLFDFALPEDRIALRPAHPRDSARLLVVRPNRALEDRTMRELPQLLQAGDALVVNDTKVIPASLNGRRIGRGDLEPAISATLIKRLDGSRWLALVRPAKRLALSDVVRFGSEGRVCFLDQLDATVEAKGEGGEVTFAFAFHGAVHFTAGVVETLRAAGIALHRVTLHVGAGTFLPVKTDDISGHRMQAEWGTVSAETATALNMARRAGGRVVAVGSTSLRLLESAADEEGRLAEFSGETDLFITPGYRFRTVDAMLTNFHLPRSTLFMLVCAFCGLEVMQRAYAHAIEKGYRFYSYGDACLLFPAS